jgi:hypothetical protein
VPLADMINFEQSANVAHIEISLEDDKYAFLLTAKRDLVAGEELFIEALNDTSVLEYFMTYGFIPEI